MSTTIIHPSDPLAWKQADVDVHVATRGGEYAGFVEYDGSAHLVRDAHGTELGAFPELAAARRALEISHETPRFHPWTAVFRRGPRRVRA